MEIFSISELKQQANNLLNDYVIKEKCTNNELLITGGAGFLGCHLIEKILLSKQFSKVHALVRNKHKLFKQFEYFQLSIQFLSQINIIEGDINNLTIEQLPDVEHIIHSAAQIHCLKSLKQLWADNVLCSEKICQMYQYNNIICISTLSVFVSSDIQGQHSPISIINNSHHIYGGYAQSKVITEMIAERYGAKIVRLGLLTGSTQTGIFPKDFFTLYIKTLHELQVYPTYFENAYVDMTPVNLCAELIMQNVTNSFDILHIANSNSVSIKEIIRLLNLKKVSVFEFKERVNSLNGIEKYLLLYSFFKTKMLESHFQYFNVDLFQSTNHQYCAIMKSVNNTALLQLYIDRILACQHNTKQD